MPSDTEVQQLGEQTDAIPDLSGAGIGFIGDDACTVLRASAHTSGLNTYVVLQEEDVPPPPAEPPKPDIKSELIGIGFNCVGAVLAWSAMAGEGLAAPASGGSSLLLEGVTYAVATATSAGVVTEFPVLTAASDPWDITKGPDGNMWFTEAATPGSVGRITPVGVVTEFAVPSGPFGIAAGPDGNLWFTEPSVGKIGRFLPP